MRDKVLDEVVRQCTAGDMTTRQLRDVVKIIADYLRNGQTVVNDGREYFKQEIERLQNVIVRKTNGVGMRIDELQRMIMTTNDRHILNVDESVNKMNELKQMLKIMNEKQLLNIDESRKKQRQLQIRANIYKKQIQELNTNVKKLGQTLNDKIVSLMAPKKKCPEKTEDWSCWNVFKRKQEKNYKLFNQQKWFHEFTFDGKRLIKLNGDEWFNFIFFNEILSQREFRFKVKIVKSQKRRIFIGVMDYNKCSNQKDSYNSQKAVCYFAKDGRKFPDEIKEGNGVDVGETVDVIVNRKNKTINWMVNGVERAGQVLSLLQNNNVRLYPFVVMYERQDIIEYMRQ